jgi:hypothetical protein
LIVNIQIKDKKMASLIPKFVKKEIADVWVNEAWKLMLLKDTYIASASHQYISDVSAHEILATGGYALGGVAVAGKASVADGNNYFLDVDNTIIGPAATLNFTFAVLYQDSGNPATSKIRAIIEFAGAQVVTNGTSTITWNALGIIYLT